MSANTTKSSLGIRLLTDDLEIDPILDSTLYSTTAANVIKGTFPKLSIGIYGEWGSGKTTIMQMIEKELKNYSKDVLTVWFNAWRYEREDRFAVIALMKTIAFKMVTHPHYRHVSKTIFRGAIKIGSALGEKALSEVFTEKGIDRIKQIPLKTELLAKVEKQTIYFDGIKKIEDEMKKIRSNNSDSRVVVFIDDLDRCSPSKALEIFESVKVFLDIEGFVFVIGLSHTTISKLISAEYEKSGINGAEYIRKIIQVPIVVPEWNTSDIELLIERLSSLLDEKYSKLILENKKLIAYALRANPREAKQFINNFIISYEIFSVNSYVKVKELISVIALKTSWPDFFSAIISDNRFYAEVKRIVSLGDIERRQAIKEIKKREGNASELDKKLLGISHDLWRFLLESRDGVFEIVNWDIYRRATRSINYGLGVNLHVSWLQVDIKLLEGMIEVLESSQKRETDPQFKERIQEELLEDRRKLKVLKDELEAFSALSRAEWQSNKNKEHDPESI